MDTDGRTVVLYVAALLIGITKAGFGGGTGVLVTPLMVLILPAKEAVGLMLPLLSATDVVSLAYYWGKWDRRNVLMLLPGAVVGILLGSVLLGLISDVVLKKTIGVVACVFVLVSVYRERIVRSDRGFRPGYGHGVLAGTVTGLVSTLAHVGGVVTSMYLLPQRLTNRAFVGTTTAVYFLINLIKFVPYVALGLVDEGVLRQDLILMPGIVVGVLMGIWANRHLSRRVFSWIVLVLVLATGVKLLVT